MLDLAWKLLGNIDASRKMNRKPPASVCKALRQEVNYGCPFLDCGSPFLTWHHFDPPWREHQHHNPEGMIALCANHAQKADSGVYTKEQLKRWKANPFVKDRISEQWPWEPENLVFLMGGCVFFGVRPLLTLRGRKVFCATREIRPWASTASVVFDLDLVDPEGHPIVEMKRNWLTIHTDRLDDLRFTPGSKQFCVSHISGLQMAIQYYHYSPAAFERRLSYVPPDRRIIIPTATEFAKKHSVDSEGRIPVVTLTGKLFNEDVTLDIRENEMEWDCHFFHGEKVRPKPSCSIRGHVSIVMKGQEILRLG